MVWCYLGMETLYTNEMSWNVLLQHLLFIYVQSMKCITCCLGFGTVQQNK